MNKDVTFLPVEDNADFGEDIQDLFFDDVTELGSDSEPAPEKTEEPADKDESSEGQEPEPEVESSSADSVSDPEVTPVQDDAPVPEPSSEVTDLKAQIATLTELVNKLSTSQAEPVPEERAPVPKPTVNFSDVFKDLDFESVVDSKEGFIDFMSKMFQLVHENAYETMASQLPRMIDSTIDNKTSMQKLRDEFYEAHPELAHVKGYVGQVAGDIKNAEPELSIEQVLIKTAETVKKALGLNAIPQVPKPSKPSPTLPGSKGTRQPSKPIDGFQDEIDDLLND